MENEIDSIDKKIEQLRNVMLERYNNQISKIDLDIAAAKDSAIESVVMNRAALVKELDDRLALIKQFPSILDADKVCLKELVGKHSGVRIQFQSDNGYEPDFVGDGKWKVLVLAKRIS